MISGMMQKKRERLCNGINLKESPELSLGLSLSSTENTTKSSSSSESDGSSRKKRKQMIVRNLDYQEERKDRKAPMELQVGDHDHRVDPLPYGWEQCLDLSSGSMYYLNRKTLKKSWIRPKEVLQTLNLELNISTVHSISQEITSPTSAQDLRRSTYSSATNMVAVACVNCHLLVMLSKSSPLCPNCRFVHALQPVMHQLPPPPSPRKNISVKSLETLSLLD